MKKNRYFVSETKEKGKDILELNAGGLILCHGIGEYMQGSEVGE